MVWYISDTTISSRFIGFQVVNSVSTKESRSLVWSFFFVCIPAFAFHCYDEAR